MILGYKYSSSGVSIKLPASKSISNRMLVLKEILKLDLVIENLSESEDTSLLLKALNQIREGKNNLIDVHHAGTDMRFLTAFLSVQEGEWIITGSERMKLRPIGVLVDALRALGADITFPEKEGYPPLKIRGKKLQGGEVNVDSSVSSQFISALLMIAPTFNNGLSIHLKNKIVSTPYMQMTIDLMKQIGIKVNYFSGTISVAPYKPETLNFKLPVEPDWSSASYWYSICALVRDSNFFLEGLKIDSLQGDSVLSEIYSDLGVLTEFNSEGATLKNIKAGSDKFEYDFNDCPDIAQTVAVTCFALNIPAHLTGLSTLKNKETDRILALKNELGKFGAIVACTDDSITIQCSRSTQELRNASNFKVQTYNDHRMAMAFAPLAIIFNEIEIHDPSVVVKSYPDFWKDLERAGFSLA